MLFARKPDKSTLQQKLDTDLARAQPPASDPSAGGRAEPETVDRQSKVFATRGPDREMPNPTDVLGHGTRS